MDKNELLVLLHSILRRVIVVPFHESRPWGRQAIDLMKDIDPDDEEYIACCLAYPGSILWSDDRALKRQKRIRILNTNEMTALLASQ